MVGVGNGVESYSVGRIIEISESWKWRSAYERGELQEVLNKAIMESNRRNHCE